MTEAYQPRPVVTPDLHPAYLGAHAVADAAYAAFTHELPTAAGEPTDYSVITGMNTAYAADPAAAAIEAGFDLQVGLTDVYERAARLPAEEDGAAGTTLRSTE